MIVQQWKGQTLISLREYYEKDGKLLPTSKGKILASVSFATAQMKSVAYIFAVHVVNCLYLEYDTPVYFSQFCDGCSIMLNVALFC